MTLTTQAPPETVVKEAWSPLKIVIVVLMACFVTFVVLPVFAIIGITLLGNNASTKFQQVGDSISSGSTCSTYDVSC